MNMVLQVDVAGTPQEWLHPEDAATILCNGNVAWTHGRTVMTLHGGWNRIGDRSTLDIPAIIATKGMAKNNLASGVPSLTNPKLFARDRFMCAYCGDVFPTKELNREHIHPVSRGGQDIWMNVVTTCRHCNWQKGSMTLEESGLSLLYLPYEPNWFENFLLRRGGKVILADQMEFLMGRLPSQSRMLENPDEYFSIIH